MQHKQLSPQDSHSPSQERVENNSGSLIPGYRCLTYIGIGTLYPSVSVAGPSDDIRGISQSDIQDGSTGYALVYGIMYNLNTSAWPEGTSLYCGASGILSDVSGSGPQVANVLKQHATLGVIQVTCLDTPTAGINAVADTDSIDMNRTGSIISADVKLSATAASADNLKATTTIKSSGSTGLHVEYPFATSSIDGVLKNEDWDTFNNKVNQTDPRFSATNQVLVKKNPGTGEFLTVEAALASITTNSISNRFEISVAPGIYLENPLTMKPYVSIIGSNTDSTVIQAINPNAHLITACNNSLISDCTVTGATGSSYAAIFFQDAVEDLATMAFFVNDVKFGENHTHLKTVSTTKATSIFVTNCRFGGTSPFTYGMHCTSTSGKTSRIIIRNSTTTGATAPNPIAFAYGSGVGSEVSLVSSAIRTSVSSPDGVGVQVADGALARILGTRLTGFATSIYAQNTGVAPKIFATAVENNTNTIDIQIDHPGTLGQYIGQYDPTKIVIDDSAPFAIFGKDLKVITVAKRGGDYTSIEDAINSISSSGPSNRYLISVGAGVFNENPIVVPQYVSIRGASIQTTVIQPIDPNEHLLSLNEGVEVSFLSLQGISGSILSGKAAINCEDAGDFAQLHKLSIYDFDIGIQNVATGADSVVYAEYVDINGNYSYGIKSLGENGFSVFTQAENFYCYAGDGTNPQIAVKSEGIDSELLLHTIGLVGSSDSNGIIVNNGGYSAISGAFISGYPGSAIKTENTGAAPTIEISGTSFEDNGLNLDIQHPDTDGNFTGFCKYLKISIAPTAPFFVTNKDAKIIIVAKKGGDFDSIKDAIDSISGQSLTNQYVISVGPGIFEEDQIVGKEFVTIVGRSTTIKANDPSVPLIIGADAFTLNNVSLEGVTDSGIPTIYFESSGNEIGSSFIVNDIAFNECDTLVHLKGSTFPVSAIFNNVQCGGVESFNTGFIIEDIGAGFTQLAMSTLLYQRNFGPYPTSMFKVMGAGSELDLFNSGARNDTPTGTFIEAYDAANIRVSGTLVSGWDKVIYAPNTGAAPTIRIGSFQSDNTASFDAQILHPGTMGVITGSYDSSKIYVDDSSTIAINIADPTNSGSVIVGPLRLGTKNSNATDVTDLIQLSSPSGSLSGGIVSSSVNPLDVSVSAGFGYILDSVTNKLKKVSWSTTIVTVTDNANNYIYINGSGVPTASTSLPSINQTILLSRVRSAGGTILFKARIPYVANNAASNLDEFLRTALGPIFVSGSILTENISTPRSIDITAGQYWFSRLKFTPSGGIALSFSDFYKVSGVLTQITSTVVDNTKYDNGTDLVNLTSGYYVKHAIYIAGDGVDETYALVRGQAEYSTLLAAQQADLPNPPSFFQDITAPLFALIMQQGTNSIVDIINIQPRIGFQSPSTSASADHGSLLGLGDDDHTQYLRTDGSRALTGDQSFGGHNVTNVGTVNGVTVETHAARHAFNGADPFLSATPQTVGTTNAEGTDNTHFSRADHVHAHGNLPGGASHAAVTTSVNGYMSAADKVKLDGVATGATANATDAQLRDRATHTGTQLASTVSDFSTAADARITAQKGAALGLATLDAGIKIPIAQIPTAAPSSQTADQSNAQGSSSSVARADHIHNIATAAPVTANADGTNSQGTANTFAKSDHKHDISVGTPVSQSPDQANAAGSSSSVARADHVHNIPAAAPITTLTPATTNAEGTGTSFARNDHTHTIATGITANITTIQPNNAAAAGSLDSYSRADHVHAIVTAAPSTTLTASTTNAEGSSTSFSRADHTHAIDAGLVGDVSTIQPDDAAAAGSSPKFSRADHKHAIATASAVTVSTSTPNAEGVSTSFARADHTHDVTIDNSRVSGSAVISTTSTTGTLMTGMTITPAAGTYIVRARATVSATSNARHVRMNIYSAGVLVPDTEVQAYIRTGGTLGTNADIGNLNTDCVVTVNGSQAVEIRWRTTGGTAQAAPYALNLTRIS